MHHPLAKLVRAFLMELPQLSSAAMGARPDVHMFGQRYRRPRFSGLVDGRPQFFCTSEFVHSGIDFDIAVQVQHTGNRWHPGTEYNYFAIKFNGSYGTVSCYVREHPWSHDIDFASPKSFDRLIELLDAFLWVGDADIEDVLERLAHVSRNNGSSAGRYLGH